MNCRFFILIFFMAYYWQRSSGEVVGYQFNATVQSGRVVVWKEFDISRCREKFESVGSLIDRIRDLKATHCKAIEPLGDHEYIIARKPGELAKLVRSWCRGRLGLHEFHLAADPDFLDAVVVSDVMIFRMHEHGFSEGAQKRFMNVLDNLANVFESASAYDPKILNRTVGEKTYQRKPVFLTLTVPDQNGRDDREVKNLLLDTLLDNLVSNYGVKMYVWRAEAQLRGAIHFHIALDAFLFHEHVRRLWWNLLNRYGMTGGHDLEHSSRIAWLEVCNDLETIRHELAGYFGADRDDEGKIIYKHDREKRVRDIEGNAWGASRNLKYRPLCLDEVCEYTEHFADLMREHALPEANGKTEKAILQNPDDPESPAIAWLYMFRKSGTVKREGKPVYHNGKKVKFKKVNPMPLLLDEYLLTYHFREACKIYGGELRRDQQMMLEDHHTFRIRKTLTEKPK